jgi:hypothetical protein
MTITNIDWRPTTNKPEFYKELIEKGIFSNKSHIFGVALALGYVFKRRSTEQPSHNDGGFVRIMPVYTRGIAEYPLYLDFTNFIFEHYAEGNDERAKLKDMEKIAEGGIELLMEQRLGDSIPDIAKVIQLIREAQPATT